MNDLRQVESHFAFGKNWESFAASVGEANIIEAERSLARLISPEDISGKRFLDLGCGSGLMMVAAARLGAAAVQGADVDPHSVNAAATLCARYLPHDIWSVRNKSVFDLAPEADGVFDVVYSWGVLHHTGDMAAAIERAASLVAPDGQLVIALYRKTPLCPFWVAEKRLYSKASGPVQLALRSIYKFVYSGGLIATGRNPVSYRKAYKSARGMSWDHDVHDWLGGYPYESASPDEVRSLLARSGFSVIRAFEKPAALAGLFGSHCDEFVAVRSARRPPDRRDG